MSAFFGNVMSSLQPAISSKSLTARANASTSSINVSSTANNRGTLTYNWKRSGKTNNRINANTSSETTITGLDTDDGTTVTYCDITDSVTGVTTTTPECVIIWIAPPPQDVVISGTVTYTGSVQAYTLTGTPATPAPSGTLSTFINAGTYVYPTNITSITTDSDYTLGTVSGSFTIGKATLTITTNNASMTYGSSVPAFTYTPTGFVNSETAAVISGIVSHTTTGTSSSNVGTYVITPSISSLSATNYTFTPANGTLTISPATLAATGTTGSATYTGSSQTVTVISGVNGTFSGSRDVTAAVVGTHTTTINGTGNYTGSVTGRLTIGKATLTITTNNASMTYGSSVPAFTYTPTGFVNSETAAVISGTVTHNTTGTSSSSVGTYVITPSVSNLSATNYTFTPANGTLTISPATLAASTTTSPYTVYNRSGQSFTISGINGTYTGSASVSGTNAGSYSTTIYGTGNYTGSVTGTLNIYQDVGYVDIFYGGVHDASRTSSIFVPVRTSNAAFTVTHSVSGPGAADAQYTSYGLNTPYDWNMLYDPVPPGTVVRNTNPYTQGFVVTITAAINDSNYSYMSATTSVTVNAYVAPSGGGGFVTE